MSSNNQIQLTQLAILLSDAMSAAQSFVGILLHPQPAIDRRRDAGDEGCFG